jgi:hypothetical protein
MTDHPAGREPELLTITEAADLLRAPVATLRYWRHLGIGPPQLPPRPPRPVPHRRPPRLDRATARPGPRPSMSGRRPQACRPPQRLETALTRGAVVGTVI